MPNTVILPCAKPKMSNEKVTPPPSPPNIVIKLENNVIKPCREDAMSHEPEDISHYLRPVIIS